MFTNPVDIEMIAMNNPLGCPPPHPTRAALHISDLIS